MVAFPNCKINIGLCVTEKRADGFHNLETVFYPIQCKDAIEIIEDSASKKEISFSQTGTIIPGTMDDNICIKAYHLLKKDFPHLPNVKMHLHKAIPMGAGLGGGSADASFMLKLIDQKFNLGLSVDQLLNYALILGSDCPFFILNKPCFATGRGEKLEAISLTLSSYKIVLVNPGIHINTGWAFSKCSIKKNEQGLKDLLQLPVADWQQNIHNEFESPVFKAHPEIAAIKSTLIADGAIYASMSGTGSTVYGLFEKNSAPQLKFPSDYFLKWV